MKRRTRIVATLGPATESKKDIKALIKAGMNIARLNFSHGTPESYEQMVKHIRAIEKETGKRISIMQDLQGPKIRTGNLDLEGVKVKAGETICFSTKITDKNTIHIPYSPITKIVKKGESFLIEDGSIRGKIQKIEGNKIWVKFSNSGIIKKYKGINIPDSKMPSSKGLTSKDKKDLEFGIKKLKVDAVAISFVEKIEDLIFVKKEIAKHSKTMPMLIAKIERKEALKNLEEIINEADGIMVARGDLGIEIPAEQVPIVQKRILKLARFAGKPVIIATQILQSMIENPSATRAEISDASNAVFDLADAFMLSNETAVGSYAIKAVETLDSVAKEAESAIFEHEELYPIPVEENMSMLEDEAIALNACYLADDINADALVIMTNKGYTARSVIKHRPFAPLIITTNDEKIARHLNFLWGANDIVIVKGRKRSEEIRDELKKRKLIKSPGDMIIIQLSDTKRSLVILPI